MAYDTLGQWLADERFAIGDASLIADVMRVRARLIEAARERRAVSYAELLGAIGLRFTRPRMLALCKTLDAIDREAAGRGEPALAVLVVRESDRLPGQGWWTGVTASPGYAGSWTGPAAVALIEELQAQAFQFWAVAPE